jgi:hypothetical protein
MKILLKALRHLFARMRTPSAEEQYLAQAIDANELEVRLRVLERGRP